ncbi:MAG: 1-acyl-sn-glycerol-3-phosphate acyltransferase [Treponema sp.]|nr:1-acyl-sn-glycerol-3-phosphate acyltransferase [Treponema sp.]
MKYVLIAVGAIFGLLVLQTLFLFFIGIFVNPNKIYPKFSRFYYFELNVGTFFGMLGAGIIGKCIGREKVPEGPFVLVSNHVSNWDPIVTWWFFRKWHLAFISKEKNFHRPAFGRIIRRCCFLSIDRADPRQSIQVMMQAAEYIKTEKVSIGIYPEGTRNKNYKEGLLPFHDAVFKIAKIAKVPVVVVSTEGTPQIGKNLFRRTTKIQLEVLGVIPAEEVQALRTVEIGDKIRSMLTEKLYSTKETC